MSRLLSPLGAVRAAALPLLLSGCLFGRGSPITTARLDLVAAPAVNGDAPIRVDLVLVRDAALLAKVLEWSARDWFGRRDQLERDYPGLVARRSWELVPGQREHLGRLPWSRRHGRGLLLFADFAAPGLHRSRLDRRRHALVTLETEGLSVADAPAPR
ncbi:MAG: type VI secretion protein [Gemmatimonadales bacterium]|nr:type VI secretion protein [Gemmatimonadales bacterium]